MTEYALIVSFCSVTNNNHSFCFRFFGYIFIFVYLCFWAQVKCVFLFYFSFTDAISCQSWHGYLLISSISCTETSTVSLYYNETKVHPSICPSISGKNQLRDENGKGTMGYGSGMGLSWGLVGVWGKKIGRDAKIKNWLGSESNGKGRRENMLFCRALAPRADTAG